MGAYAEAPLQQKNTVETVLLLRDLSRRGRILQTRGLPLLLRRFLFDVFDYVANRLKLLRIFIRHFD